MQDFLDLLSGRLPRFVLRRGCTSLFGAAAGALLDPPLLLEGQVAAAARKAFAEINSVWSVLPDTALDLSHLSHLAFRLLQ